VAVKPATQKEIFKELEIGNTRRENAQMKLVMVTKKRGTSLFVVLGGTSQFVQNKTWA
jgi:hypothetical protein